MMRGLAGKRVLVTGAATGIGRATALRFAEEGASVAINFVGDPEPAEILLDELGDIGPEGEHLLAPADVSDEDAVDSLFAGVVQALGGLDILVNNAAIKVPDQPHEAKIEDFDRVIAVNLRGAFLCAQAAVQHFLDARRPGAIITTSSVQQVFPVDPAIAYVMSKAALAGLTKSLALRYARDGIRVNAVGPGAIRTPMNADLDASPAAMTAMLGMIPMARVGEPEEIAALIAFLASDDASYITGQTVFADGGMMLGRMS